jgi:hypothetical protein
MFVINSFAQHLCLPDFSEPRADKPDPHIGIQQNGVGSPHVANYLQQSYIERLANDLNLAPSSCRLKWDSSFVKIKIIAIRVLD